LLPHSSSLAHGRHVFVDASHTGAEAFVQSLLFTQPTHV